MGQRESSPFLKALDSVGRTTVAMREALQYVEDNYSEGEEQQQVRDAIQQDFPAIAQKAQEMAQLPKSYVTYKTDETGGETVQLWTNEEILTVTKSVDPTTNQITYDVINVTATEKPRFLRSPLLTTAAHINDSHALQRARKFFDITPTVHLSPQLPSPQEM